MRQGCFEVLMFDKNANVAFKEKIIDNECYASAAPDIEYTVIVNVYRNSNGVFPCKYLRIGLFIDNIDVNYWKRMDLSDETVDKVPGGKEFDMVSATFSGFQKGPSEIVSFLLRSPTVSSVSSASSCQNTICGNIRVEFFEARIENGVFDNVSSAHKLVQNNNISSQEKFWKVPSIVTEGGRKLKPSEESFVPLTVWKNTTSEPFRRLELKYHTDFVINTLENIHGETSNMNSKVESRSKRFIEPLILGDPCSSFKRHCKSEENEEECIVFVPPVPKNIPLIDMSNEE